MSVSLNIHGIRRIEASAYSTALSGANGERRMHWQTLCLFDANNVRIGQVVLFFDNPTVALPVGDRSQLDGSLPRIDASLPGCSLV